MRHASVSTFDRWISQSKYRKWRLILVYKKECNKIKLKLNMLQICWNEILKLKNKMKQKTASVQVKYMESWSTLQWLRRYLTALMQRTGVCFGFITWPRRRTVFSCLCDEVMFVIVKPYIRRTPGSQNNVHNFAVILYCSTIEFKQNEVTFLKSNHSWTVRNYDIIYTLLFWQLNTQQSTRGPKRKNNQ